MLRRVILAGLSICVLGLTFGFTQTANAQERLCWVNAKTGKPVPNSALYPLNSTPNAFNPNQASVPSGPTVPGIDFVRGAGGSWVNAKTGARVPDSALYPLNSTPNAFNPNQASVPSGPTVPGIDFVRVSCPPSSTTSSGLPPTGGGTYAIGGWNGGNPVLVLGSNIGGGWSRNSYSDFPTFDGSGAGGGVYGAARYYVQPNFFVGPEAGFMFLDINARNPDSAFGIVRSDAYLGGQAGVTVQGPGASKINFYTGVDADWSRISVGVEAANERMSKNLGGWSVHSGVEFQPIPSIPTLWLGLDLRHSDVSGTIGGDPTRVRWNMLSLTLSIQR